MKKRAVSLTTPNTSKGSCSSNSQNSVNNDNINDNNNFNAQFRVNNNNNTHSSPQLYYSSNSNFGLNNNTSTTSLVNDIVNNHYSSLLMREQQSSTSTAISNINNASQTIMNQSQQQSDINNYNLNLLTYEQQHVIHEDDNVHFELENFTIQHLIQYFHTRSPIPYFIKEESLDDMLLQQQEERQNIVQLQQQQIQQLTTPQQQFSPITTTSQQFNNVINSYNINNEGNDDIGFLLDESNTAIYEEDFYQSPSNTNPTPNQAKQQINLIKKDGRFVQKEIKPHIKPKEYDHLVSKFKFK